MKVIHMVVFDTATETKLIEQAYSQIHRLEDHPDLLRDLRARHGIAGIDDAIRICNGLTNTGNPVSPRTLARAIDLISALRTACERELHPNSGDPKMDRALSEARAQQIAAIEEVLPLLKRARVTIGENADLILNGVS